jgi:hypothetical protein
MKISRWQGEGVSTPTSNTRYKHRNNCKPSRQSNTAQAVPVRIESMRRRCSSTTRAKVSICVVPATWLSVVSMRLMAPR